MTEVCGTEDQLRALPDSFGCPKPDPVSLAASLREALGLRRADPPWGERIRDAYARLFTARLLALGWDRALDRFLRTPKRPSYA